ncbi:hypothetical protein Scep_018487 [Stephania cephalantha]|uniref:Uncharacterized protein n=1 Tax=Stephania cephalantha TaxID=152367 RepID=A0AAP0I960_9MAGN
MREDECGCEDEETSLEEEEEEVSPWILFPYFAMKALIPCSLRTQLGKLDFTFSLMI